jgi:uncharacterized protein (TIGR00645 family)
LAHRDERPPGCGPHAVNQLKPTEHALERALFAGRWLMAPFYIGLIIALGVLMVIFVREIIEQAPQLFVLDESQVILWVLTLIDLSLAGNLILMVVFSGYENFVSKMDIADHPDRPAWMGTIDFSAMKLKLLASIVAISAIHLLKTFMSLENYSREHVVLQIGIHLTFVVSGALLAFTDYISEKAEAKHVKHGANHPAANPPEHQH